MHNLAVVFSDTEYVRTVFFTLIVRTDSLSRKYPGGIKGFIETHGAKCNRHLAILDDLSRVGFEPKEDAVFFPASDAMFLGKGTRYDVGVPWLEARATEDHAMLVRHVEC